MLSTFAANRPTRAMAWQATNLHPSISSLLRRSCVQRVSSFHATLGVGPHVQQPNHVLGRRRTQVHVALCRGEIRGTKKTGTGSTYVRAFKDKEGTASTAASHTACTCPSLVGLRVLPGLARRPRVLSPQAAAEPPFDRSTRWRPHEHQGDNTPRQTCAVHFSQHRKRGRRVLRSSGNQW
jgi:hypothetical protein